MIGGLEILAQTTTMSTTAPGAMDPGHFFLRLALAVGLGLIVGLQRERASKGLAGIRTYPIITILGFLLAVLTPAGGYPWLLAAALLAVAGLVTMLRFLKSQGGVMETGIVTEVSALVMLALGYYLLQGRMEVALVIAGGMAVLMQYREPLHQLADKMGENDIKAIMQFVVVALVILPILPNEKMGPYNVFNPFEIWLVVVLIVGISFGGYVAYKLLGERKGMLLGAVLGGLVSSTATTVSFSRLVRADASLLTSAVMVIMLASAISVLRVLVLAWVMAPAFVVSMLAPMGLVMLLFFMLCLALGVRKTTGHTSMPAQHNPAQLRTALVFGGMYALIKLAVAAGNDWFGSGALYPVAMISGLTDVDAITLATADMVRHEALLGDLGWRLILVAIMANLVFKAVSAGVMGGKALFLKIGMYFGIIFVVGLGVVLFWPHH
jgi:uncharacterized membrane protein (DUF4010 family)